MAVLYRTEMKIVPVTQLLRRHRSPGDLMPVAASVHSVQRLFSLADDVRPTTMHRAQSCVGKPQR